jgi:hypothetical protein
LVRVSFCITDSSRLPNIASITAWHESLIPSERAEIRSITSQNKWQAIVAKDDEDFVATGSRGLRDGSVADNNGIGDGKGYKVAVALFDDFVKTAKGRWNALTAHPMVYEYLSDISIASSAFRGKPAMQLTHIRTLLNSHFGVSHGCIFDYLPY